MADHQAAPSINPPEQSTLSCSHPPVPSLLDRKALSTRGCLSRSRTETGSASVPTPRRCGHPVDGALASWQEVESEQAWRDLLLGNGLSSHIWPAFAYGSLYARACTSGLLASGDRELFTANATENFETVLRALAVSIGTLSALGEPAVKGLRTRYMRIQPLPSQLSRELQGWRELRLSAHSQTVFCGLTGARMRTSRLEQIIGRAAHRVDLNQRVSAHILRNTAVAWLKQAGASPSLIAAYLAEADSPADQYADGASEDVRAAVQGLADHAIENRELVIARGDVRLASDDWPFAALAGQ